MDIPLEEGEISDSSEERGIDPYTPLERPVIHYTNDLENDESGAPKMEEGATSSSAPLKRLLNSDSESDDELVCSKRLKLSDPLKNKYSIWTKDPNGDLTDILNQVDIMEKPSFMNCRNVENYPLPFNNSVSHSWKRKTPVWDKNIQEQKPDLKSSRILDPLEVNESNTIEEVADDITKKLKEYNDQLILRIVIVLGKDRAIQLYEKTRTIEKLGGMPILNCSRKRTSGGVFIFLVRSDKELSEDKLKAIFEKDLPQTKKLRKISNKIKKKRKGKRLRKSKNKGIGSEISNPPPSPDLPELPQRKDVITGLACLDQQPTMSDLQDVNDDKEEEGDEEEDDEDDDDDDATAAISSEEMDLPELT